MPDLTVANVIPTIGSKEFVALLPTLLGLGPGDVVVQPTAAYPSYAVGAAVVGANVLSSDEPDEWPDETKLVWLNSPGNPDGRVQALEFLRRAVVRARELGAVIANDECYAELDWDSDGRDPQHPAPARSRRARGASRCRCTRCRSSRTSPATAPGFVAGCSDLVGELLAARKHLGLMPPAPVQAAMIVALGDDGARRRAEGALPRPPDRARRGPGGSRIPHRRTRAGLYLWATRDEDAWATVDALARLGILVAPGSFYGASGGTHVRVALTATDERIAAAVERLAPDLLTAAGPLVDATLVRAPNRLSQ